MAHRSANSTRSPVPHAAARSATMVSAPSAPSAPSCRGTTLGMREVRGRPLRRTSSRRGARRLVAHRSLVSPLPDQPRAQVSLRADRTHSPHMTFQGLCRWLAPMAPASPLTGVRHTRQSNRGARLLDAAVLTRIRQFRWSASQSDELRRPGAMSARRVGPSMMKGAGRRSLKAESTWLDW